MCLNYPLYLVLSYIACAERMFGAQELCSAPLPSRFIVIRELASFSSPEYFFCCTVAFFVLMIAHTNDFLWHFLLLPDSNLADDLLVFTRNLVHRKTKRSCNA